jgi:hypothetical protein
MPILVSRSFASSAISTSSSSQRIVMICFISFASYGCSESTGRPNPQTAPHRPHRSCSRQLRVASCHAAGSDGSVSRPQRPSASPSRRTVGLWPSAALHVVGRLVRSAGVTAACSTLTNRTGGTHSRTSGGCCDNRPHRCNSATNGEWSTRLGGSVAVRRQAAALPASR